MKENSERNIVDLGLKKVFVAGPFFKLVDPVTGRMPAREQALIEGLISHFESTGSTVYNAHKRERWGADFMEPPVYTRLDFEQISASELLVVMPGSPPSLGTHIELGWASALGKPMVLLLDPEGEYAGMIHGLGAIVPTAKVALVDKSVDFRELDRAVFDVMGRARRAA